MKSTKIISGIICTLIGMCSMYANAGIVSQTALSFGNEELTIKRNNQLIKSGSSDSLDPSGYYSISEQIADDENALYAGSVVDNAKGGMRIFQRVIASPNNNLTKGEILDYEVSSIAGIRSIYSLADEYSKGKKSYVGNQYKMTDPVNIYINKNQDMVQTGLLAKYEIVQTVNEEYTTKSGELKTKTKNLTKGGIKVYGKKDGTIKVKTYGTIKNDNIARIIDNDDPSKPLVLDKSAAYSISNRDFKNVSRASDSMVIVLENIAMGKSFWVKSDRNLSVDTVAKGIVYGAEADLVMINNGPTALPETPGVPEPATIGLVSLGGLFMVKRRRKMA
eukprot:Anaeramoba_ignava/a348256_19.p1 GENE.a348256_19~~a348256_19.p1  ORF type:complete len:334 (-),score=-17.64 a348256_19:39-1040(-)